VQDSRIKRNLSIYGALAVVALILVVVAVVLLSRGNTEQAPSELSQTRGVIPTIAAQSSVDGKVSLPGRDRRANPVAVQHPADGSVPAQEESPGVSPAHAARTAALERDVGVMPSKVKVVPKVPNRIRVDREEALPCTAGDKPINFEIFSAGTEVAGLSVNQFHRRCERSAPADEAPANLASYVYGHCEIPEGQLDCEPPLEIQSFPACERSLADYTFEGKPLPYRELPSIHGAEVVEIAFQFDQRIEVYTGSTTIVIYAATHALAEAALEALSAQEVGAVPATSLDELAEQKPGGLGPPTDGAIEGDLPCRT
jgi:hypothetical protein